MSRQFTYPCTANNEDAFELQDGTNFNYLNDLLQWSSRVATTRSNVGLLFPNITIVKDTTILSASLSLEVLSTANDDVRGDIHYEPVDSADDFQTTQDVTSRTRSGTSVEWVADGIGAGQQSSPDIKTLIQEIVNRAGWVNGNDICILLIGRAVDPTKTLNFEAFDAAGTEQPRLVIEIAANALRSRASGGIL